MANISQPEHIVPASRVYAAAFGATLTVFALVGGLMGGLIGVSFTFHGLIEKAPNPLTYTLAAIVFGTGILGGRPYGAWVWDAWRGTRPCGVRLGLVSLALCRSWFC
jgi:hypothetical protein